MTVIERTDTVAHFIGGEEVPSASGRSFPSIDPSTGREIAQVAFGEAEDVDRAVAAGRAAFESGARSKAAPGHPPTGKRRQALQARVPPRPSGPAPLLSTEHLPDCSAPDSPSLLMVADKSAVLRKARSWLTRRSSTSRSRSG